MIAQYLRAALVFVVAVLIDALLQTMGSELLGVANADKLPSDAPPLVQWGHLFLDYFLVAVLISLLIYLLVAAWLENQAPSGGGV